MTPPNNMNDEKLKQAPPISEVMIAVSDETLGDLVEITLRLDGIPIQENQSRLPGLLIADTEGFQKYDGKSAKHVPEDKILLLISDETDIPEGTEYLVVPKHGNDYELDPHLLVRKVREMLSGRKPSAERNQVTGLPGAAAFEAELRERVSSGERFGVVFADLNGFKSFNRAYTYARGDELLVAVAELIESIMEDHPHPQNFISHLGNDDFALITSEKSAQTVAEEIVDAFDEMVAGFYDVADLARGYVMVNDRKGNEIQSPIVTIALAVVLSSRRAIEHSAEIIDIAEDLLDYLKKRDITESCCIVERKDGK